MRHGCLGERIGFMNSKQLVDLVNLKASVSSIVECTKL